jgi:hypothetical protein
MTGNATDAGLKTVRLIGEENKPGRNKGRGIFYQREEKSAPASQHFDIKDFFSSSPRVFPLAKKRWKWYNRI